MNMTEGGKGTNQRRLACDLCSKAVSWTVLVNMPLEEVQQAVSNGFDPFHTPDIYMPSLKDSSTATTHTNDQDRLLLWRQKVKSDTEYLDSWYVCPDCARALCLQPEEAAEQGEAPAVTADKSGKSEGTANVDVSSIILFMLCLSWVGSMILFVTMHGDYLWLVTLLAALCSGAGAAYFIWLMSTQARKMEAVELGEEPARSHEVARREDKPRAKKDRKEEKAVPEPVLASVAQPVAATEASAPLEKRPIPFEIQPLSKKQESAPISMDTRSMVYSAPVIQSVDEKRITEAPSQPEAKPVVLEPVSLEEARRLVAAGEWDRLANSGGAATQVLIEALSSEQGDVHSKAAAALAKMGDPAMEPLFQALKSDEGIVRKWAAWTLGVIGDRKAVEPLTAAMADEYDGVRENSAWALGQIRDPRALEYLAAALYDEYVNVRQYAAWSLGELMQPEAVPPLLMALKDASPSVRQYAVAALAELKDNRAVDALILTLKDSSPDVRGETAFALAQIRDERAVMPLINALNDSDDYVRQDVVKALGKMGSPKAVQPLVHMLNYDSAMIQMLAVSALAEIDCAESWAALEKASRSLDLTVADSAQQALAARPRDEKK